MQALTIATRSSPSAFCSAHRSAKILGAKASVHARDMVGRAQHVGKRVEQRRIPFRLTSPPTATPRELRAAAPSRSPSLISTRASASRPTELTGSSANEAAHGRVPSRRSCHSLASARRRSKDARANRDWPKEGDIALESGRAIGIRSSAHSISFCATGSLIDAASAGSIPPLALPHQCDCLFRRIEIGRKFWCRRQIAGCRLVAWQRDLRSNCMLNMLPFRR